MKPYQEAFIRFALESGVLKFGEFTLKSGRLSPYFFNAGLFSDGNAFYQLSAFYSDAIQDTFQHNYEVLFGPAYKGISLATSASIGLKLNYDLNVLVSFNRKEAKDHGEGGTIIGADLANRRVLLVDDVITAGTTIRESANTIQASNGKLVGAIILLDRQEKGLDSHLSAIQEVEQAFGLTVNSIITLDNLIEYLQKNTFPSANKHLEKISAYRNHYGISR
jgi:orotate phosphoribosyltransferase